MDLLTHRTLDREHARDANWVASDLLRGDRVFLMRRIIRNPLGLHARAARAIRSISRQAFAHRFRVVRGDKN